MNDFFADSSILDYMVLRPLAHIRGGWDVSWDAEKHAYAEEENSFAGLLNFLIAELAAANPPARYHDSEDRLAEYVRQKPQLGHLQSWVPVGRSRLSLHFAARKFRRH